MPLSKKRQLKYISIGLTGSSQKKIEELKKKYGLSQQDIINQIIIDYKDPVDKN